MGFKGVLSVSLYVSAMLLANRGATPPSAIDASIGLVVSGGQVEVKIAGAPCQPLTVTIEIGNYHQTVALEQVPGSVFLDVPAGSQLKLYTVTISCASDRAILTGVVV
jgi:hypothetical protein